MCQPEPRQRPAKVTGELRTACLAAISDEGYSPQMKTVAILRLHRFHCNEIAARLNISETTAVGWLHKIRRRYRRLNPSL